jgi:ABC-2 type transport system ATP-binding protein
MIEQGRVVFAGTVDEFDNYIVPNTLIVSLVAMPAAGELLSIPGISGVEELGGTRYRLKFDGIQNVKERIVETSVARGWRLTDIYSEKTSLDTIFAELSKK